MNKKVALIFIILIFIIVLICGFLSVGNNKNEIENNKTNDVFENKDSNRTITHIKENESEKMQNSVMLEGEIF